MSFPATPVARSRPLSPDYESEMKLQAEARKETKRVAKVERRQRKDRERRLRYTHEKATIKAMEKEMLKDYSRYFQPSKSYFKMLKSRIR